MAVHCNICNIDIDEKDVDIHIKSGQHEQNKKSISSNDSGLEISVAKTWRNSLNSSLN
jgi:hypothetical protein